jgi:hypothetical protein
MLMSGPCTWQLPISGTGMKQTHQQTRLGGTKGLPLGSPLLVNLDGFLGSVSTPLAKDWRGINWRCWIWA